MKNQKFNEFRFSAAKIMQDALDEFRDTPEENRVIVVNASLSLRRGDVDGAIGTLRAIGPGGRHVMLGCFKSRTLDTYVKGKG